MGHLQANDMQNFVEFDTRLRWHLQSNHYPPVPDAMYEPCVAAIDAANEDDYDRTIDLTGIAQYRGGNTAPAWAIIEAHHLDTFIASEEN
jgi:hypothetical protein